MTQMAITTDLNRCVSCLACGASCKEMNDVPIGNFWLKVIRVGPNLKTDTSTYPDVEMYYLPVSCQHCKNPCCVEVCPTEASTKQSDGTVQINKEKCIGCQFCVMACPYGVRYLNEEERVVEKCTLCEQRTLEGELPRCVVGCGGRARYYGDLDKGWSDFKGTYSPEGVQYTLESEDVIKPFTDSQVYALPDVGNGPSGRYILRKRTWRK